MILDKVLKTLKKCISKILLRNLNITLKEPVIVKRNPYLQECSITMGKRWKIHPIEQMHSMNILQASYKQKYSGKSNGQK